MDRSALDTYEAMAEHYDAFNHRNDYEMWLGGALLPELERHGLRTGRALDVGCGTGRAFQPLLDRGWAVSGCDLSPAMIDQARRKFGDAVPLLVADLRELPALGEFELVIALNDVVNYLTEDGDLERALGAMRANLAPDGLFLFDANTLGLFRENFVSGGANGEDWHWLGLEEGVRAGGVFEAEARGGEAAPVVHRQRHHTEAQVREAMAGAGLEVVAALGQSERDGRVVLADPPDEERDYKVVYVGRARR